MTNQPVFSGLMAELKEKIDNYQLGEVTWSDEERIFAKHLEQLPFDFQILHCFKDKSFALVKGLKESFGHSDEAFDIDSFYWNIHPEDVDKVISSDIKMLKWMSSARNASIKKTLLTAQFRFSDRAGNYRLVNRNSLILKMDDQGRASCIYHMFVDVSESEQFGRVKYRFQHPGKKISSEKVAHQGNLDLTRREKEILQLIVEGYSSKEISTKLYISRETVYRHRKNMIKKTNVKNTKNLALRAVSENWV